MMATFGSALTTKTMAAVRVYPSKTVRRFGKHKVAAVAESWGESA